MSDYATLKAAIQSAVYTNGNNEITGAGLQSVLLQIVNTVGSGYVLKGVATTGTAPGTPDANVFYIAPAGTYTNFGTSYEVPDGFLGVFVYNGSWTKYRFGVEPIATEVKAYVENIVGGSIEYKGYILTESGYVSYNTGELVAGGYNTTKFLQVSEGDTITVTDYCSASVAVISAYSSNDEATYIKASSVVGTGNMGTEVSYTVPAGVNFVRLSCNGNYLNSFAASVTTGKGLTGEVALIENDLSNLDKQVNGGAMSLVGDNLTSAGYVSFSTGELTAGGYNTSKFIAVSEGDEVSVTLYASPTVALISAYSSAQESTYIQMSSIAGANDGYGSTITYTVPAGVNYLRFSCSGLYTALFSASIVTEGLVAKVSGGGGSGAGAKAAGVNFIQPSYILKKNRVSVNFSFDDGLTQDVDIKGVFEEFGYKCGFAILSAQQRYFDFANEGFEILAHNTTALSSATEQEIRASMTQGKAVVESLGLICHGWVTPSSALPSSLRWVTNDYFEYGFTIYKGNVTTDQTMTSDLKSYGLWRVHMDTFKDYYTSILSDAMTNDGMISVYGHGNELGGAGWSLATLRTILQYCNDNLIEVLTPYQSCLKLFEAKHNE